MSWGENRRSLFRAALGVCLILVLAVSSLSAQGGGADAPTPNEFDLSVLLGERATSNSRFQGEDEDPTGDYITDLGLNLDARRETARTEWALQYRPNYTTFHQNTHADRSNHNFRYRGAYLLSEVATLNLRDQFFYSRDPVEAGREESGEVVVLTNERRRWRNAAEIDVDFATSRTVTLKTGVQARVDRFEDPEFADSERYDAHIGVGQRVGRLNEVDVIYTYSRFNLDVEGREDSNSHAIDFGWSRGRQAVNEVGIAVGVSQVDRGDERQNQSTGSTYYRHRFRRLSFNSGFRQNLSGDTGNGGVNVARNVFAGVAGPVGKKFNLGAFADYGTRKSVFANDEKVDLDYVGATLRASWSVTPRFGLSAQARHREQTDSTGVRSDVTVNSFSLNGLFKVF